MPSLSTERYDGVEHFTSPLDCSSPLDCASIQKISTLAAAHTHKVLKTDAQHVNPKAAFTKQHTGLMGLHEAGTKRSAVAVADIKAKPKVPWHVRSLPTIRRGSIAENFRSALADIDIDGCEAHGENAFFVCNLAEVWRQHKRWQRELGHRVEAFFAVKCNPDPYVLRLLAALGLGFDCASQPEIASILNLPTPVDPSRIIYANPCKAPSFIRHAAANGVNLMTFDNYDELVKTAKYHPHAQLVLRILTDDSGSLCKLGLKFGSPISEVRGLLQAARKLALDVVGVSFHCGSGCTNPALYRDAICRSRWVFDVAAEYGFCFTLLDIGGGFGDDNFESIADVVRHALEDYFPTSKTGATVRVIAEPGRYYVSRAFELATNIIARRTADEAKSATVRSHENRGIASIDDSIANNATIMYYVNDGVYGAFNCILFDHQIVHPSAMTLRGEFQVDEEVEHDGLCSVWGPTCDSIDCIQSTTRLPTTRLDVGDWLRWRNMGAYTICAASQFNGFRCSEVVYTIDAHPVTEDEIRSLISTFSAGATGIE